MQEIEAPQLLKIHGNHVLVRDTINNARVEYNDSRANYKVDAAASLPELPEGILGVSYIPGEKRRMTTGAKLIPLSRDWPQGDAIIATAQALVDAKIAREAVPVDPAPPGLQEKRTAALEALLKRRAADADASPEEKAYQMDRDKGRS